MTKIKYLLSAFLILGLLYLVYNKGYENAHILTTRGEVFDNVEVISWSPRILYFQNIISDEDCDHIIKLGENYLKKSLVFGKDGKATDSKGRTSYGTFMTKFRNDSVMQSLSKKIAAWSQFPEQNAEDFYLLRYENGQEYKPHRDYITLTPDRPSNLLEKTGNRFATVLTYLSDVEEGGETIFPVAEVSIKPKKGDAVLFFNLNPDGSVDPASLHGGKPVIKGTKWCLTRWIREYPHN